MQSNIFDRACLIQLSTSCWVGSKNIHQSIMDHLSGSPDWLRGKKLLVKPEFLNPIKATIQQSRQLLLRYALPFPMTGLHLMPKNSIEECNYRLELFKTEFISKVNSFANAYQQAREEARDALGELFLATDYPEDILSKFRFTWSFVVLDVPSKASFLSPEVYRQEKEKFEDLMTETRELAIAALREEFGEIVHHLSDKIAESEGKPKVLRSNMTDRIFEFLDGFENRNLFQDGKLTALVNEARNLVNVLNGNVAGMQSNDAFRQKLEADFGSLKKAIDAAIIEMPRRKIFIDYPDSRKISNAA